MKTPEEFKVAAKAKEIRCWIIHNCSMCQYPCGYHFSPDFETVQYDSGCDCVRYPSEFRPSNWSEVAQHYNMQKHEGYIVKMNNFWGFNQLEEQSTV